jgi:flagellar biosynthesis protein FlhF
MMLDTFEGPDLQSILADIRAARGDDVLIVSTRGPATTGGDYEVDVAAAHSVESLRERLGAALATDTPKPPAAAAGGAPAAHVVALVGPPGAGKTTTIVKLALNADAFGGRRVGLITLDTYRAAAVEQLHTFAEIAGLPLEVIHRPGEVDAAFARLAGCEVILVDTPGRNPRNRLDLEWRAPLKAIAADEVHLVIPASMRADIACTMRDMYRSADITHALITRIDELPDASGVIELTRALDLPARWVTDGHEVPLDLRPASAHLLGRAATPPPARARQVAR